MAAPRGKTVVARFEKSKDDAGRDNRARGRVNTMMMLTSVQLSTPLMAMSMSMSISMSMLMSMFVGFVERGRSVVDKSDGRLSCYWEGLSAIVTG